MLSRCLPLLKLILGSQLVLVTGLSACQLVLLVLQCLDLLGRHLHIGALTQQRILRLEQDTVCPCKPCGITDHDGNDNEDLPNLRLCPRLPAVNPMNLTEESAEFEVSVHFTSAKSGLNGAPLYD